MYGGDLSTKSGQKLLFVTKKLIFNVFRTALANSLKNESEG